MAMYLGPRRSFEPGILDRNHRAIGFWGLMLVAIGVAVGVPAPTATVPARITNFTHVERSLIGSRAGSHRPHWDIPLIVDAYRRGQIKLDELVSARYPMEDWETAVHDLHDGKLARGVLTVSPA